METNQQEPPGGMSSPAAALSPTEPQLTPADAAFSAGVPDPALAIPVAATAPGRRQLLPWLLVLGVVLAGGAAAGYWTWFRDTLPPDPRLTYPTRYLNVRPGVAYVGDARCATCHKTETDDFHHHPMGQSLAPVAEILASENLSRAAQNPFVRNGLRYEVIKRGNTMVHKESMIDPTSNETVYEKEMEITHALGSREHGITYLFVNDGRVWQSPISWYTKEARWDLSPGYEMKNLHFNRPVLAECLVCHANQVVPIKETFNSYEQPVFRGYAIGCERCHGPGELHVRRRESEDSAAAIPDDDDTIVNPKKLADPVLREAVCQQCHLAGEKRVNRLGRDISEYRPGLPLHYFVSTYVTPPDATDSRKAVSQVEQVALSKCYEMSNGKLGCISCHDGHRFPTPKEQVSYYRERCLNCHKDSSACSLPLSKRQAVEDSCYHCHMPALSSSNIVHASITDHRILKKLPKYEQPGNTDTGEEGLPLALFHENLPDPARHTRNRDLGIALARYNSIRGSLPVARWAKWRLEATLKQYPDDVEAEEAFADTLKVLNEYEAAYRSCQHLLERHPGNEKTLILGAGLASQLGHWDEALDWLRGLAALNPDQVDCQGNMARMLIAKEQWGPALKAAQAAVKIDPSRIDAHRMVILCHARLGQKDLAREALKKYLRFKPSDAEAVKRWLD